MEIVLIVVGILLLAVFIAVAIRASIRVVPHGERLVVYRLGRFHRIVGPGLVLVLPRLDRVVQTLQVRDQPIEVTVDGLFVFGMPTEMTLNLWCSFDLVGAAGGDRAKLANFVQFSDGERRRQVEVKVREALVRQIADLQKRRPVSDTAAILERIKALAPGSLSYNELLEAVKRDLHQLLPTVGAILNTAQPVTLVRRTIPDEVIEALKRSRSRTIDSDWLLGYVDRLRGRFPDLSNAMLVQILASIEGVDIGKVQRLLLEHDAEAGAEVEYEMARDGEGPNVVTKPKMKKRDTVAERQPTYPETDGKSPSRTSRTLAQGDLTILKRVPRGDSDQRLSA